MKISKQAVAAALVSFGLLAGAQNIAIRFEGGSFRIEGWQAPSNPPSNGWPSVFEVYAGMGDVPPLQGSYAVEKGVLVFHPLWPISPGVHYRAVFHLAGAGPPIEKFFDGPPKPTNRIAKVEQVYPSGDVWPSNQLRLYIYFSEPMSRGEAARYIHVLDSDGKDLHGSHAVFLPGEELWDAAFQRLTMTFDPGRIKRGLTSNETIGPPLVEGKSYTLVIDSDWPDARGVPMARSFRKSLRGGPARRTPPDPKQWNVTAPKAGSTEDLVIDFPAPMNYPLLQRMLRVTDSRGGIGGRVTIARHEMEWRFTSRQPWSAGSYQIVIDTGLEDLAGNHIGQPFDLDVFNHVTEHITTTAVTLPFTVH